MRRVFLTVLDSFGVGELPDASAFGDEGSNTLKSISKSEKFHIPNLLKLGISRIEGLSYLGQGSLTAAVGKAAELSKGKDTTVGHWEISGLVSKEPFPTYKDGFPQYIIDEFTKQTGRGVLCNKPYSGTEVIKDYGEEHIKSGDLIVYTSADSVFQIAAHESVVPVETLYEYCRIARKILCGRDLVARVIARPFCGEYPYERTNRRHDFSAEPFGETMLDAIKGKGLETIGIGKINDIFAGKGISEFCYTSGNDDGIDKTAEYVKRDFNGLCFINLVDFDSLYGHRNDTDGYAAAISEFDRRLPEILNVLNDDDVFIITADHGCDPMTPSTDHSREYIPIIVYGKRIRPCNIGVRKSYSDIAATVCDMLGVKYDCAGRSFYEEIKDE